MPDNNTFEEWAILELMGHRKIGGLVTEAELGGIPLLRIDIPSTPPVTQFYGKAAIYALTPTTEEIATHLAQGFHGPVQRYELPAVFEEDCRDIDGHLNIIDEDLEFHGGDRQF